ncbi:MAG: phosphate ABC transporter substrate-binding/OmpA family protein [Pseudomonadota bacterium]
MRGIWGRLSRTSALCGTILTAVWSFGAAPVMAQDVVLRSREGPTVLAGQLVSFDGELIEINTALGRFSVDAFLVTCDGIGCPPPDALRPAFRISGSNMLGMALMPALIEAYGFERDIDVLREPLDASLTRFSLVSTDSSPNTEITLAAPGTSEAFRELLSQETALGMASRQITGDEIAALRAAGLSDPQLSGKEHVLALDGLLVLVSPDNPLRALSIDEVASIFAGRTTNWSQLGGPNLPISVHVPGPATGTRASFETLVMAPYAAAVAPNAVLHDAQADLSDAVASDPGAIGIAGFADRRNARPLDIRLECGIVAQPDSFSIKAEEYPLARRLYLYVGDRPMPPQARELVAYSLSQQAQTVIADAGFVDQSITGRGLQMQGMRLASTMLAQDDDVPVDEIRDMVSLLVDAERLSITLRFQPGASLLDTRAEADVERLASHLASGELDGKEVMLIGFTDSVGRGDLNRALSERRATLVRDALISSLQGSNANIDLTVLGFGEMSPLGCNETFEGRRINRRVEVWVRDPA